MSHRSIILSGYTLFARTLLMVHAQRLHLLLLPEDRMGASQGGTPRSLRGSQGIRERYRRTRLAVHVESGRVARRAGTAGAYRADQAGSQTAARAHAFEGPAQPAETGQRAPGHR